MHILYVILIIFLPPENILYNIQFILSLSLIFDRIGGKTWKIYLKQPRKIKIDPLKRWFSGKKKKKHLPSEYEKGDAIIVKITKSGKKIKGKGKTLVTSKGEIVQRSGNSV